MTIWMTIWGKKSDYLRKPYFRISRIEKKKLVGTYEKDFGPKKKNSYCFFTRTARRKRKIVEWSTRVR